MRARSVCCLVIAGTAAALTTACSAGPHHDAAGATALSFVRAIEQHDGGMACALLVPDARKSVAGTTNVPCARAIVQVKERGAQMGSAKVWGDAAQVHVGSDVLFLRRWSGHWRVSAAGCRPQPAGPYDCDVSA